MINQEAGMLEESTGLITEDSGMITDNDVSEYGVKGRRKRSRERDKDSKPRDFPLHMLKNLPQFRNKSHEEIRQYLLEKKGVDIGGNFNWNGFAIVILIIVAIVAGGYGVWKWHNRKNNVNRYQE